MRFEAILRRIGFTGLTGGWGVNDQVHKILELYEVLINPVDKGSIKDLKSPCRMYETGTQ